MNKQETVLISGNEAIGEGAIRAGCRFYGGYPITPQNELTAYMAEHLPQAGGVSIQAESELAAINMVFGAAAAGVRAMTSSSSPGISLKQEGISYMAGAELPGVIVNMMRGGPGLGNIAPSQSDYFQATKGGGHGDYHCIVFAPAGVQECYDQMFDAFDCADRYRTPVIVLGDGLLGQMMEPLVLHQGVVKEYAKPWSLTGARGRKPNIIRSLYLKDGVLEALNETLQKKYNQIRRSQQRWESLWIDDAKVIVVAYGGMSRIVKSAVRRLRQEKKKVGIIRPITLWPFPEKAFTAIPKETGLLCVEMSYGQMIEDVKLASCCRNPVEFLGRAGGGIPGEEAVMKKIRSML